LLCITEVGVVFGKVSSNCRAGEHFCCSFFAFAYRFWSGELLSLCTLLCFGS